MITLETQKCRKGAPRSVEFNLFLLIAIDKNGFRRMKGAYRVGLRAEANFSAQTFKPAHKARAGQRAALSI